VCFELAGITRAPICLVCIAGKKFGVTDFINPADCEKPLPEVIKEMTDGGVDYAFECTGCEGMISIAFESCQNVRWLLF
jgi:Zn-dependent alcohol dehydrogenase